MIELTCWMCLGEGMIPVGVKNSAWVEDMVCPTCHGNGYIEDGRTMPPDEHDPPDPQAVWEWSDYEDERRATLQQVERQRSGSAEHSERDRGPESGGP